MQIKQKSYLSLYNTIVDMQTNAFFKYSWSTVFYSQPTLDRNGQLTV